MADKIYKCNICGAEVDYMNGGCALQFAFCRKHYTTLSNISFCAECYKNLLADKWRAFVDAGCLEVGGLDDD